MKKRYIIGLGIIALVIVLIVSVSVLPKLNPPSQELTGLGGAAFFGDARMIEYLDGQGYTVKVITNTGADSYPQKGQEDYSYNGKVIDLIQAGSVTFKPDVITKFTGAPYNLKSGELPSSLGPVKMLNEYIIGQTPMVMWLKDDRGDFSNFVKAGFVKCEGDVCYMDSEHLSVLVNATIQGQTWEAVGINGIPGTVNLGVPTGSGGRATSAMLLSCWKPSAEGKYCESTITPEMIATDEFHQAYNALYAAGGQIPAGDDSLLVGKAWFPIPSYLSPTVTLFATESSYVTWYKDLSDNGKKMAQDLKIHAIYLERPIMTTFTVICNTEECKAMMEKVSADEAFQQIMSEVFGVRAGLYTKAPTFAGKFIDPAGHYSPMTFPLSGVTSTIKHYYDSYGK